MNLPITAETLKSWYEQNKEMTVIDARSKPYFDGTLLPQAKWLPYDAPDSELRAALPSKTALIVVYCSSETCRASQLMVDRLIAEGYTQVYKYAKGLSEWMGLGYPTTHLAQHTG